MDNQMKITGRILAINDTEQISDTFQKRTFVLTYAEHPQYPEYITFALIQDRCSLIDGFQVGQNVEVSFNLKGRQWQSPEGQTKYFNSLQAWRIEPIAKEGAQSTAQENTAQQAEESAPAPEDDLPF
ncbi:MAG: DUF3127 domain-containing protein [Bacteroidota bacterium]